jgi:hypothetical protein
VYQGALNVGKVITIKKESPKVSTPKMPTSTSKNNKKLKIFVAKCRKVGYYTFMHK